MGTAGLRPHFTEVQKPLGGTILLKPQELHQALLLSFAVCLWSCCVLLCTGITTIDTADNYGGSELLMGQHLRLNPQAAFSTQVWAIQHTANEAAMHAACLLPRSPCPVAPCCCRRVELCCMGCCCCPLLLLQVMTKLSFMKSPAAVDLRRENIEYVSVPLLVPLC